MIIFMNVMALMSELYCQEQNR